MPQYLGKLTEINRFETVAVDSDATFVEIILMDTTARSIQRFSSRGADDPLAWHRQVRDIVERTGGKVLLADMYDRLGEVIAARTNAVVVPSIVGAVHQTYKAVAAILDNATPRTEAGTSTVNPCVLPVPD